MCPTFPAISEKREKANGNIEKPSTPDDELRVRRKTLGNGQEKGGWGGGGRGGGGEQKKKNSLGSSVRARGGGGFLMQQPTVKTRNPGP